MSFGPTGTSVTALSPPTETSFRPGWDAASRVYRGASCAPLREGHPTAFPIPRRCSRLGQKRARKGERVLRNRRVLRETYFEVSTSRSAETGVPSRALRNETRSDCSSEERPRGFINGSLLTSRISVPPAL